MKAAICQLDIKFECKTENMLSAEKMIKEAAEKKADVIFFPEMTLTGFSMNISLIGEENHETETFMRKKAEQYNIAVGFGWVKKTNGLGENHYTVLNSKGEVLADYIKIHPFSYGNEDKYYKAGERIVSFELHGKRIGVFICYDLRFPEVFQIASKESEVIVVAANWPEKRISHWNKLIEARAIENQCWIIGVNCFGNQNGIHYNGSSRAVNPQGDTVVSIEDKQGLLFCDIDDSAKKIRESFPLKKDRRISFYKSMM